MPGGLSLELSCLAAKVSTAGGSAPLPTRSGCPAGFLVHAAEQAGSWAVAITTIY